MAPQGLEKLQMDTRIEAFPAELPHCENQAALQGQQCWQALLISVSLSEKYFKCKCMNIRNLFLIIIAFLALFLNYIVIYSLVRFVDYNILFVFHYIFYLLSIAFLLRFARFGGFVLVYFSVLFFVFLSFNLAIVLSYLFLNFNFFCDLDLFFKNMVGYFSDVKNIFLVFILSGVWFFGIVVFYAIRSYLSGIACNRI